jgi:predicted GNAT superfamily acetyltransferase
MSFQVWNPDWFQLPGQAVFDRQYQQIAAVARDPGNLDLFVIGFDNKVWTTAWNAQTGKWNGDWTPLPGQAVFDREHQQIAAVARDPGNLDLFVIGFDNKVWTTAWNAQTGKWNGDWAPLPGQAVFDREHQQIAAVARDPGNLDLFVIGFDNKVWTTAWNAQTGKWNGDWAPLPGQAVFDREHQQIAVTSRASNILDLFVLGFENHSWSTVWGPRNPMTLDVTIDQTSQIVPVGVDIHIGATDGIVTETNWNIAKDGVLLSYLGNSVPAGIAFLGSVSLGDPGSYMITVNRTGLIGPSTSTTLTKQFFILARLPAPPPPPPPPPTPPTIEVTVSGSIEDEEFHITGSGFLPDRPNSIYGIAIRFVDDSHLNEITPREYTNSLHDGAINCAVHLNLSGIKRNAEGLITIDISATDGKLNPVDKTIVWSNTVRMNF